MLYKLNNGFPGGASGKEPTCQCKRRESQVGFLDQEDPLKEEMQPTPGFLTGEIPWTEKAGGI